MSTNQVQETFDLSVPRYNTSTFLGRMNHFFSCTSPLTLLASSATLNKALVNVSAVQARLRDGQQALMRAASGGFFNTFRYGQTSSPAIQVLRFRPYKLGDHIRDAGTQSIPGLGTVNQTLNVCVNYSNANKSNAMSTSEIATAYVAATGTSVGLAVSLRRLVPKLRVSPFTKTMLGRFIPFFSVASAGLVNLSCMRWKEFRDGVQVFDKSEQPLGKSQVAGSLAIAQTGASRVLVNIPTLVFPPILLSYLTKSGAFSGPRGKVIESLSILTVSGLALWLALPPAMAYYPQKASVKRSTLEASFSEGADSSEEVYFNKGL